MAVLRDLVRKGQDLDCDCDDGSHRICVTLSCFSYCPFRIYPYTARSLPTSNSSPDLGCCCSISHHFIDLSSRLDRIPQPNTTSILYDFELKFSRAAKTSASYT